MGIKCTDGVVLVSALSPPALAPGVKQAAHPAQTQLVLRQGCVLL